MDAVKPNGETYVDNLLSISLDPMKTMLRVKDKFKLKIAPRARRLPWRSTCKDEELVWK
jgi:hypothetical protein